MRTAGTAALVLEVDVRRRVQCPLQLVGADEWRAAVHLVLLPYFIRYRYPGIGLIELLPG